MTAVMARTRTRKEARVADELLSLHAGSHYCYSHGVRLSRHRLLVLIAAGVLSCSRAGALTLVRVAELDALIASMKRARTKRASTA